MRQITRCLFIATLSLLVGVPLSTAIAQENLSFFDDFQGTQLNPAFRVLNPDKQRMALTQGEFLLLVTHQDRKNVIEYTSALPENYEVTIRLFEPPTHREQAAQLRIGSDANNVRVGAYQTQASNLYLYTDKTLDGVDSNSIQNKDNSLVGEPLYLRFSKIDVEFEGAFSLDGLQWKTLGKQVLIDPNAKVYLEVSGWGEAPESPIKIDSFEVREITN